MQNKFVDDILDPDLTEDEEEIIKEGNYVLEMTRTPGWKLIRAQVEAALEYRLNELKTIVAIPDNLQTIAYFQSQVMAFETLLNTVDSYIQKAKEEISN